jgi:leucyl aminopeptidase
VVEGLALSTYRFEGYKTEDKARRSAVKEIVVVSSSVAGPDLKELTLLTQAVFATRDLVNEPVGSLNAVGLGQKAVALGQKYGFTADVFDKAKIEALKFGGLLAVNKGSIDPPTFSVLKWKPENAINEKPYVLVGKGVVFDTGGINLKTPPGSLDTMKCDMGGAAAVLGTLVALAANKIPLHVVGLMPSTDNRPCGNAMVPGDIIRMHNGKTVEILNTDAEGRLILADALSYAERFNPAAVIDLATLTGAAAVAIGGHGTVGMGTADEKMKAQLEVAGEEMCERVVWFPFWEEYDEEVKSTIADVKNLGSREGGAITAGKFLAQFVKGPWIHLDIAGPAFNLKENNYRGNGGTGVGVRLLYRFFQNLASAGKK